MRIQIIFSLFIFFAAPNYAQNLFLKNAKIMDPAAQIITEGNLLIENGFITDGPVQAPDRFDGEIIDLTGKWVLPGLNDMHVHSFGNTAPGQKFQFLGTEGVAKVALYAGITAFLDLFAAEDYILSLQDRQRQEGLPGADIFCAGPCFTCTNGHCSEYGVPTRIIDTPEDAHNQMKTLAQKKPDVIKLVYDHNFTRMPTANKETMEAWYRLQMNMALKRLST